VDGGRYKRLVAVPPNFEDDLPSVLELTVRKRVSESDEDVWAPATCPYRAILYPAGSQGGEKRLESFVVAVEVVDVPGDATESQARVELSCPEP
jgi:hypothetical protein